MRGDKTKKKLKPIIIISVVCGIRNTAYFFYPESLEDYAIISKKYKGILVDSERVCALWADAE